MLESYHFCQYVHHCSMDVSGEGYFPWQWRTQEFLKVQGIALRGAWLLMGGGRHKLATGWYGVFFLYAELLSKVFGARVGRVLIYPCDKCGHASALRRLDGRPKAKGTGHVLNARMLGTPLSRESVGTRDNGMTETGSSQQYGTECLSASAPSCNEAILELSRTSKAEPSLEPSRGKSSSLKPRIEPWAEQRSRAEPSRVLSQAESSPERRAGKSG